MNVYLEMLIKNILTYIHKDENKYEILRYKIDFQLLLYYSNFAN